MNEKQMEREHTRTTALLSSMTSACYPDDLTMAIRADFDALDALELLVIPEIRRTWEHEIGPEIDAACAGLYDSGDALDACIDALWSLTSHARSLASAVLTIARGHMGEDAARAYLASRVRL